MSATPIDLQFQSLSSATAEGAAAIQARELAWAMMASANTSSGASGVGSGAALKNSPYLPALYSLNDPYLQYQWHLQNVGQEVGNPDYQKIYGLPGQDINVTPVWNQGITGEGVLVAVIDNGVQTNHPDLAANIHPSLSFGNSPGDHGTAVAGLIAAVGNNDKGGTGVAPDAQIVPIRIAFDENFEQSVLDSFQYAITNGVAVTNNSYGFAAGRSAISLSPELLNMLRSSVLFGRNGLGMINVFASGNSAGPAFVEGFPDIGSNDSAAYNAFANSRYTIAVTGVDHDGQYINADGTFTDDMEAGPSVLVAAPTGSYATAVADDAGTGSGIFTTDLTGNNGYNVAPLPSGFEIDTDYFDDPDYTSRFNGTSASAPIVSGVIALMLQANPQLNWRDVQEILVRSARQNAQFERAASGGIQTRNPTTWQTNQSPIFQEPDPFNPAKPPEPGTAGKLVYTPTLDGGFGQSETSEPALFMNGAGYTVSQGYGVYTELIGYGHGVVDADLAVKMAQQWHQKGQNLGEELTFTTFVNQVLLSLPAAERGNDDSGNILVPGGLGGESGFIEYWNEYFVEDDPEDPEDGPFSGDDPPDNTRGFSFIEFNVPEDQNMAVESVDVKVSISGPSEDLDHVRLLLVSPDGTHSELNHFYVDPENDNSSMQAIDINFRDWLSPPLTQFFDPGASIDPDGGSFVWTFNTNRSWGERSDDAFIIDPISR